MITSLRIENFALIDEVHLNFTNGFTVITGETGSGKSILLNALNLILGERANFDVIGNRKDKSMVEVEIDLKGFDLQLFFTENDLDYFETCIVRREISKQGRSRAFVNDSPVQLTTLKGLSAQLVRIHSQYNTLELKDVNYQLTVLDTLAGTVDDSKQFAKDYRSYRHLQSELETLKQQLADTSSKADYNAFQLQELRELKLDEMNYESLQSELSVAENADDLKLRYSELAEVLNAENGVVDRLQSVRSSISKHISSDSNLNDLYNRLGSVLIELSDIADESEERLSSIEIDPARVQELAELLDNYNRITFKHKVDSQEQLISLMNELEKESSDSSQLQENIDRITAELEVTLKSLNVSAQKLHENRKKSISAIEKQLKSELSELKLKDTELTFDLATADALSTTGISKLEILFSPNAGIPPVPVHKAASGGELSRVMLGLQSLMAAKTKLRTVFFDEIDTGVSGDVAQKVGNTLSKMGQGMQVIAITHLPQVAAKGGQHFKVSKSVVDGKTTSSVVELNHNERIEETARLMSGDEINQAALENAKALMG